MITHLEPDILEYEVKWALGSITKNKASGGDGIPVELFQILKDDVQANLENSAVATGLEKVSFHSSPKEGQRQVLFSSVTHLRPTLCDPMDCSTPDLPVHHQLLEFTQTYDH